MPLDPAMTTLERIVPDELEQDSVTGSGTYQLHMQRYEFAARFARGPAILDIACGVGYGSYHLAERAGPAAAITGVDIDPQAIAIATTRYRHPQVTYQTGDCIKFDKPASFDAIVSLETVEHLPTPAVFIARMVENLKPGGIFVVSVPVTPSVDFNPHHLQDFTERSIRRMVTTSGLEVFDRQIQKQKFNPISVLLRTEKRLAGGRKGLIGFYLRHPGKILLRMKSSLVDGFCNKYITLACRKP
jgi:SAM-dependent methyltransferase